MAALSRIESTLTQTNRRMLDHARRYRRFYFSIGALLFTTGLAASVWALQLSLTQLESYWLLANLLVGAPFAIGLNAISLRISAKIVGASHSFQSAFGTCCLAICSNLLPIPAGSVIHASSLASRGASAIQSGIIVLVGNGLGLALVVTLVGTVLFFNIPAVGLSLVILGTTGVLGCSAFIYSKSSPRTTIAYIAIRALRTLTIVLRIQLSFLAIGIAITMLNAALFSGAVIMGTTIAIFPSGLGISEGLAALLALTTTIPASAAFIATALNRITTLTFAGLFLLFYRPEKSEQNPHE